MVSFPKYDNYKDSGVEWLGEIPQDWHIIRAKYVLQEIDERSKTGDEELLSVSHLTGVTPRSEKNVNMFLAEDYTGAKLCQQNDVVINTMWAWMGALGVSPMEGLVSPSYGVYRPNEKVFPRFLDSLLKTPQYIAEYIRRSTGIQSSRLRLYPNQFLDIPLLLPSLEQQKRIVEFLDRKTTEIDQAIEQKQRLIKLLKEQKSILLDRAVTKGLNPNVQMRDSGVECLDKIPTLWKSKRLKFSVKKIYDCKNRTPEYFENGEYFVIRTSNVKNGKLKLEDGLYTDRANFIEWTQKGQPLPGELVFTREAPAGEVAMVPDNIEMCLGQRMMGIKLNENEVLGEFLLYFLQSQSLKKYVSLTSAGRTVSHLRVGQIFDIPIVYPSNISEQKEIATYCSRYVTEIDETCLFIENDIEKIREFYTTLIASSVTGKIKIQVESLEKI